MPRLRVTEIFRSLQGEGLDAGVPTLFVRLSGCPLRCTWCDTAYAFKGGAWMDLDSVLQRARAAATRHVCVTGGEPLAQSACPPLLSALCDAGHAVSLETSGALDLSPVDPRVTRVMDLKAPASGESGRNRYANLDLLRERDQVKIVIAGREDYLWARERVRVHALSGRCHVLFSPAAGLQDPSELAAWILADGLEVRLQLQLHKLLWGDRPGV